MDDQQPIQPPNDTQPVAYDPEGRPLYYRADPPSVLVSSEQSQPAQPQPESQPERRPSHVTTRPESFEGYNFDPRIRSQYANEPQVVHAHRPYEPQTEEVSQELQEKHAQAKQRYPLLNLSEGEYVILDIKRHPIGMIIPIGITVLLLMAIWAFLAIYPSMAQDSLASVMPPVMTVIVVGLALSVIVAASGAAVLWVYLQNQFFMTNESVIQEIQESLFSRHEQTVSLGSIEDASFCQSGILQILLNYGTIRLSTEGEETTYVFRYVANPRKQIAILNNAIESFKNGRPVNARCDD